MGPRKIYRLCSLRVTDKEDSINMTAQDCLTVRLSQRRNSPQIRNYALDFWLRRWEIACGDRIIEPGGLVRSIAERLIGRMPTPAETDRGAAGKSERLAFGVNYLKIAFDPNRSVIVDGDLGRRHSILQEIFSYTTVTERPVS